MGHYYYKLIWQPLFGLFQVYFCSPLWWKSFRQTKLFQYTPYICFINMIFILRRLCNFDICLKISILAYALFTRCLVFLFHFRWLVRIVPCTFISLTISICFPLSANLVENCLFFTEVEHHAFCFFLINLGCSQNLTAYLNPLGNF